MLQSSKISRLMRIQARPGSPVEARHYRHPEDRWAAPDAPDAIVRGIPRDRSADLIFHGGKTVAKMEFQNVFLGGRGSWRESDVDSINTAITLAMQDQRLNNVVVQYFDRGTQLTCDPRPLRIHEGPPPRVLDEPDVQQLVVQLLRARELDDSDLGSVIFNLVLPPGTVLKLGPDNSLDGLGGYHGSVRLDGARLAYYSANVFSQILPNGRANGIPVFDAPWKNVVGTLYHEMNEFRTDADVREAIETGEDGLLGWMGEQGEIGDQPIAAAGTAGSLSLVFQEILSSAGGGRVPVQYLFSNAVHGAEGPIDRPDPPAAKKPR
jgi:hypothetical protein